MPIIKIQLEGTQEDIDASKAWLAKKGINLEASKDAQSNSYIINPPQPFSGTFTEVDVNQLNHQEKDQRADQLHQSEINDQQFIQNIDIGIIIYGSDQAITHLNQAAFDLLGLTREQISSKNFCISNLGAIDKDRKPLNHEDYPHIRAFEERKAVRNIVIGIQHPQRQKITWLSCSAIPQPDDDGTIRGLICCYSDITDLKQAEQALREDHTLLTSIIDTSVAAITVVNPEGQITYANKNAEHILGLTKNEIEKRRYDAPQWQSLDIDGELWSAENQPFVQIMTTGKPVFNIQHSIIWPDGSRKILSINGAPIKDRNGTIINIVFVIDDITKRRQMEKDLLNQEKLRVALEKERELNAFRREFMSMVSHEFRTPLAMIGTASGLLERYWEKLDEPKRNEHLKKIKNHVRNLGQMLDDVALAMQIEDGRLSFRLTDIDLINLADSIVHDLQIILKENHEIIIDFPAEPLRIYADKRLLRYILMNLLTNAVKYSPNGGKIIFQIRKENNEITFHITDEGVGIAEEEMQYLFEPYFRGNNTGQINGTGLGLKIVKDCVDLHQGTINVDSTHQRGTTFIVTLPVMS